MTTVNAELQNQLTICDKLLQRQRFLMNTPPPPRFTPISPYPLFTKLQLDMRRKSEILQYKKNSTQTNKKTKSQRFVTIVNSKNNVNNRIECNENLLKPTWTTASNIPGRPMMLQYDPTIPLYNYQTIQDTYAITDNPPNDWEVKLANNLSSIITKIPYQNQGGTGNNTIMMTTPETALLSLFIVNADSKNFNYNYEMGIPVGIYVSGVNVNTQDITCTVTLKNITLNVYYYPNTSIFFTTNAKNTILVNNHSIALSSDIIATFTSTGKLHPSSPPIAFSGTQYIANIDIKNILLPVHYGYVYDFKLSYDIITYITSPTSISTEQVYLGYLNNFNAGIVMNSPIITSTTNCNFTPQSTTIVENYKDFFLYGNPA